MNIYADFMNNKSTRTDYIIGKYYKQYKINFINTDENKYIESEHFYKTNKWKINKNEIKIYDNLLNNDDINLIYNIFENNVYNMNHRAISNDSKDLKKMNDTNKYKISTKINLTFQSLNGYFYNDLIKLFYDKILPNIDIENKEHILIDRCYYNTHTHGCPGQFHTDGKSYYSINKKNTNYYTVMLYVSNNWCINYDGSTAIYIDNDSKNNIIHVENKNGRVVVFPSYMYHKACEISSYSVFNAKRVLLVYHLLHDLIFID
jgi:hypothetical protein